MSAIYNKIGKTYDLTRKPDQQILQLLLRLLEPVKNGRFLDVACGSGNYTNALSQVGMIIDGIDISEEMISKARVKNPSISWHLGDAMALPFQDNSFDGALCTLATHHMENFEIVFKEVYRVMKAGRFVILTSTPEQMKNYWLWHYFPKMMADAGQRMASFSCIEKAYQAAGFINIQKLPYFVTNTLTDWFLYAGKYRPEMVLDPKIREGISSFHVSANQEEVNSGLAELQDDIASGKIQEIIQNYENNGGDYLFVVGEKKQVHQLLNIT